jgi:hypothetical protein
MSNVEVTRSLVINSPQEFYKIVKTSNMDIKYLIPFMDRIELFLYGCPCEAETHWDQTVLEYRKISKLNLDELKYKVGCTLIQFYLDDVKLFDV